jgi:hypothetical protein
MREFVTEENNVVSNVQGKQDAGHHTARRPELEPLVAAVVNAAQATDVANHAEARGAASEIRKTQTRRRNGSGPDSAIHTISIVKGPILCHHCQLKCTDAAHYLSHKCIRRRAG